MKKTTLLIYFILSLNYTYANKILFDNNLFVKDTFCINEIQFSRSANQGWDSFDLLEKNLYTLIIKIDGTALLKWNGKCPNSRNNSIICSYSGAISKKDYKVLADKLIEIKFTNFKDKYLVDGDDIGADGYIIKYNENNQKEIIDERFNIAGLQEFRDMIIKLKKEIKWTPNN